MNHNRNTHPTPKPVSTKPGTIRKPPRRIRLGERPPSIHDWAEMIARMEASCTLDHRKQWRGGGYGWECPRCNGLYAQALIHAHVSDNVPALAILDGLLSVLEGQAAA
jgi:hypothetical protein